LEVFRLKGTAALRRLVLARRARIVVIGQGYVGLSLACAAAEAGFRVVGVDADDERIGLLQAGELVVPGVPGSEFHGALAGGGLTFTNDPSAVGEANIVFLCVPTPVRDTVPDLSFVREASSDVARHLRPGSLVVLESTTYPGTTEQLVRPLLEETGMSAEGDFLLAYSPERIDPGNDEFGFREIPRLVGGLTPEATGMATLVYEQFVDKILPLSSCRAAELAKLLENTFRHVNIALVNEMAILCHETGIDVWEVIDAAASKPFGFMRFEPGPGVGGHCIPLDPTYLTWQVRRDAERRFRIVEQAQEINGEMPGWISTRISEALNEAGKAMKGARVLVLGVSYKPDLADVRESPVVKVIGHLLRRGAKVTFHDPFVERVSANGWQLDRSNLTTAAVRAADCVALLTPHASYDLEWLSEHATLVFDARNAYGASRLASVERL
jgi:UDP-N-acetyl-D-glucosamine dehydrogenase